MLEDTERKRGKEKPGWMKRGGNGKRRKQGEGEGGGGGRVKSGCKTVRKSKT